MDWTDKPCLEWTGARSGGYGNRYERASYDEDGCWHPGRTVFIHRETWEKTHGPIPKGMWVLHHCDNPPCYEITHLHLGTPGDNQRERRARRR